MFANKLKHLTLVLALLISAHALSGDSADIAKLQVRVYSTEPCIWCRKLNPLMVVLKEVGIDVVTAKCDDDHPCYFPQESENTKPPQVTSFPSTAVFRIGKDGMAMNLETYSGIPGSSLVEGFGIIGSKVSDLLKQIAKEQNALASQILSVSFTETPEPSLAGPMDLKAFNTRLEEIRKAGTASYVVLYVGSETLKNWETYQTSGIAGAPKVTTLSLDLKQIAGDLSKYILEGFGCSQDKITSEGQFVVIRFPQKAGEQTKFQLAQPDPKMGDVLGLINAFLSFLPK